MREYYIRREGDEDATGPFDLDQISSLIEAGKLDANAYFYDIETENWVQISANQELMDTLFPKKKKLSLRKPAEEVPPDEIVETKTDSEVNESSSEEASDGETKVTVKKESEPPREKIDVTQMLAMAEGRTEDSGGRSPREKKAAASYFALRFLTLLTVLNVLFMGYLKKDLVLAANAIEMAKSPYLILGAVDVVLSVILLLQVTAVYPLVRFRSAIGFGMLTVLFYASGDLILLVGSALMMLSAYLCSATVKLGLTVAAAIIGVAGIGAVAAGLFL